MDQVYRTSTICPIDEFHNEEAICTISFFPHLFKIISPINFTHLKVLLIDHPNQPFVDSVVHGFTIGFWPFAHTRYSIYPLTVDDSGQPPNSSKQLKFLDKQIQTEVDADRYSVPFGPDLLPGMYSTPILAVLRKGKLRLCNHQSHRGFSLNLVISRNHIAGVKLDGIHELGESL